LALAGVVCISFSAIFVRLANVSPVTTTFFRAAYALPFLLLLWSAVRHGDLRTGRSRWLAFTAGLVMAADLSFWHHAISLIGASLATVLGNTQVLFVGLAAWLFFHEKPRPLTFVTIPVIFAGVVLISGLGYADAYGANPLRGTLFGVLTGISYSCFLLVFRASNSEQTPAVGPLLDCTLGVAVVSLTLGLLEPGFRLTMTWPEHGWLLALAVGSQVVGWLLIAVALPRLTALDSSVMLVLQPVLTAVWAWLIFVERLSPLQWIGAGAVLVGVGLLTVRGSVEKETA